MGCWGRAPLTPTRWVWTVGLAKVDGLVSPLGSRLSCYLLLGLTSLNFSLLFC